MCRFLTNESFKKIIIFNTYGQVNRRGMRMDGPDKLVMRERVWEWNGEILVI